MNIVLRGAACAIVAAASLAALPASASVINWTQGSDGDSWSQSFAGEIADTLSFGGTDTSYGEGITGPMAHSHGQPVTWTVTADIDGVTTTIFSQFLDGGAATSLVGLGDIHFAKGVVTNIGLTCDSCSFNTFHQFSDTTLNLSAAVPEPAMWALMIGGFGLAGAALRRRQVVAA